MAFQSNPDTGRTRAQDGTGMVETLLAIPVLFLLATAAFQLALLAGARIQLSHAAFYAARVAAVRGETATDEMKAAILPVLGAGFAPVSLLGTGIGVEVLPHANQATGDAAAGAGREGRGMVRVRVHWDYPLLLPFVGRVLSSAHENPSLLGLPTVRLVSVWSMPKQPGAGEEAEND